MLLAAFSVAQVWVRRVGDRPPRRRRFPIERASRRWRTHGESRERWCSKGQAGVEVPSGPNIEVPDDIQAPRFGQAQKRTRCEFVTADGATTSDGDIGSREELWKMTAMPNSVIRTDRCRQSLGRKQRVPGDLQHRLCSSRATP